MPERPVLSQPGDRVIEALVRLARSAIANDRAADEQRAKLHVVRPDAPARRRGGQAA